MRVRFRGGPFHNKTKDVDMLSYNHEVIMSVPLETSSDYYARSWNNFDATYKVRTHRYQLGKDEKGKDVYFHTGCV